LNDWQKKIFSVVGLIILISGLLLVIKYQRDIINKQAIIQNSLVEMKKIQGDVTRNQTQYATPEDINKIANSLDLKLGPIKDDLNSLKAHITGIQTISVNSDGVNKTNLNSTSVTPRTDIPKNEPVDEFGYQRNAQNLTLSETFGKNTIPVGNVTFKAWQKEPWSVLQYPRKYSVINVLGTDEDGKTYTYSKFAVETNGKVYNLDINDAKLTELLPENKFRFSPRLFMGGDFGVSLLKPQFEFVPNLELMLFSRGVTSTYPSWLFLGLGLGYNTAGKNVLFMVSPVSYNVGQFIPFMKNLYLSTDIGIDVHGDFAVLGGVKVGL